MGCLDFLIDPYQQFRSRQRRKARRAKETNPDAGRGPCRFPDFPPPSPSEIIQNRSAYLEAVKTTSYEYPEGHVDNPVDALYRIYESIMLDKVFWYRNQIEYFWWRYEWPVKNIPDPMDPDPARYAFLACISELLVLAFNENIKLGAKRDGVPIRTVAEHERNKSARRRYEQVPAWATKVLPLDQTLAVPSIDGITLTDFDDKDASSVFRAKNILIAQTQIYFI